MGHAHDDVPSTHARRAGHDLVEHRHQHVEAFDREPRLAGEGPLQEALEHVYLRDAIEQGLRAFRIHRRQEPARFGGPAQPLAFLGHEDLGVVEAGARAVDAPQLLDCLERVAGRLGEHAADECGRERLQVVVGDAVRAGRERRVAGRRIAERIERRRQVAVAADRLHEVRGRDRHLDVQPVAALCRWRVGGPPGLEQRPRLLVHRQRVGAEAVVQLEHVTGVDTAETVQCHTVWKIYANSVPPTRAAEP